MENFVFQTGLLGRYHEPVVPTVVKLQGEGTEGYRAYQHLWHLCWDQCPTKQNLDLNKKYSNKKCFKNEFTAYLHLPYLKSNILPMVSIGGTIKLWTSQFFVDGLKNLHVYGCLPLQLTYVHKQRKVKREGQNLSAAGRHQQLRHVPCYHGNNKEIFTSPFDSLNLHIKQNGCDLSAMQMWWI